MFLIQGVKLSSKNVNDDSTINYNSYNQYVRNYAFNIVTCMSDSRRGFGLDFGFIDHFTIHLVITLKYGAIVIFHILQYHCKSFPTHNIFTSSCLVTASNNGYSSASGLKSPLNGGSLQTEIFFRVRVRVTLRLTVSQSVCLGVEPRLGLMSSYLIQLKITVLSIWGALSDERSGLSGIDPVYDFCSRILKKYESELLNYLN
jgi:hypothetical protein